VKPYLLDINVLIALAWPNHVHHDAALDWFLKKATHGFRTCPITQIGFVRISSNPAFTPEAVSPGEALGLLSRVTQLPGHDFWPDDVPLRDTVAPATALIGHRQITDVYLLALANKHGGVLATLDRGAAALGRTDDKPVELIL